MFLGGIKVFKKFQHALLFYDHSLCHATHHLNKPSHGMLMILNHWVILGLNVSVFIFKQNDLEIRSN